MNQTDKITNPVLVTHSRGGITESFHRGVICVVNEHGNIIASLGDVKQICFPRSALKYFQHIPLITWGFRAFWLYIERFGPNVWFA
ncbi:MAG: asparaginase [Bacteroidetes bacterium]|nr:asparaginase [Bacteroidota bacterium]